MTIIIGIRMLDGQATDALEASALGYRGDHIDIYINCWGPKDDGKTFGKPGPMAANALRTGAQQVGKILLLDKLFACLEDCLYTENP